MKICDNCGVKHPNLARYADDDPGCDHDADNPRFVTPRSRVEAIMDEAARLYRNANTGDVATTGLAICVINLGEELLNLLPDVCDEDMPTYRDTSDFHRRTSGVVGFSVPA